MARWMIVVALGLMPGGVSALCAGASVQSAAVGSAQAAEPAWQVELERRHDELVRVNGPGTDAALRAQLLTMGMQDQEARGILNGAPMDKSKYTQAADLDGVDAALTSQLKEVVAKHGWPTIALVGIKASNAALLILIHTRDHEWQRSLLGQLETLADTGKIDGSAVATLIDKELVSEGRLQRYGTQFKEVNGGMAMIGAEDPAGLDARRARVGLPPMDAYKGMLEGMYHLKVTDAVVSAK
jgi:hypothetical protein